MRLIAAVPLVFAVSLSAHALSLPEAMQSALNVHPEIRADISARLAAEEQMKAARGGYLPRVDLLAGYGREYTDSPSTRGLTHHTETLTRGESTLDRKSTRLNSSHVKISYAVFCLKKKK